MRLPRHLVLVVCGLLTTVGCAQWPKPYTPSEPNPHYFLYQDRVRIYYRDVGQGEPLVLIHGFGETSATWDRLVPELARRHRVVSIDLKGAGYSDKPADGRYRIADQAEIVRAFVKAQGLQRVTLIGHSMGGLIVLMAALQWQEDAHPPLDQLILVDSAGFPMRLPRLIATLRLPLIGPLIFYMANPDILARQILSKNYRDPTRVPDALVQAYAESMRSPGGRGALIEMTRQFIPKDVAALTSRYAALTAPTLLLHCARDPVIPVGQAEALRDALPNARLTVLPDCGHSPQEETPSAVLHAIEEFLGR